MLYQPIDEILGTPAGVRVLRVLALHGGELSGSEVARRADLSRTGAWRALTRLGAVAVVETVGQGHSVPYRLNRRHPLAEPIVTLFRAEAARAEAFFDQIRSAAERMDPPPRAVWLYGSAARREDTAESDVDIAIVGRDGESRRQAERLRDALEEFAEDWSVRPSVISLSVEEARRLSAEERAFWDEVERDAVVLFGAAPGEVVSG